MRNFKKFLTLVLAVMMVVSAMSFTTSAAFEDVAEDNEYLAEAIDLLSYMGVAKGVSDTKFGTDELVTRQQFALFIYRMMKGGKDAPANGANSTNFTDLVDPTYNYAISWAYQNGIISGRNSTTFDPKGNITLQEAYAMIVRALEYEADGEKLSYPFGYIEVAEKDTVNLPEGLDSSVDATDALTRGDMAIILYNAFFAEVGVAEIKYGEETLSDGSVVLIEKEDYPRLCEKFFDVKEAEYQAIATPHYRVSTEQENTLELGYDAILVQRVDDEEHKAPDQAYVAAKDIGLEAADLDANFLAIFTMFVTLDEDNAIEKVLYADSNIAKKTVNDIEFATVTTNKASSYYGATDAKILSGKATTGDEVIYFYNAPYSYAAPTYDGKYSEAKKYALRNEENIGSVSFAIDELEDNTYVAYVNEYVIPSTYESTAVTGLDYEYGVYSWIDNDGNGEYDSAVDTDVWTECADELIAAYEHIYNGGLYEADLYDVDGDGLYDYISNKNYYLFKVNTDEDFDFYTDGYNTTPITVADTTAGVNYTIQEVYTNGATLLGEKFEDEDFVIGYYSQAANTIKVAEVIKPVTATIKSYSNADKTITLSDDTTVAIDGAWKYVRNFRPTLNTGIAYETDKYDGFTAYDDLLSAANIENDELDLYIYDGVVLFQEGAKSGALTFSENLIIPTADENGFDMQSQFNTELGKKLYYIHAWVDGDLKWVPVETEDVYPEIITVTGTGSSAQATYDANNVYLDKLCTYSVDADGVYTITPLYDAKDENGDNVGINWEKNTAGVWVPTTDTTVLGDEEDADLQYMYTQANTAWLANDVYLKKVLGTRFELVQDTDPSTAGYDNQFGIKLDINDATRIVVKNYKFYTDSDTTNNEIEYIELDVNSLTSSTEKALSNVSFVVSNNPDQTTRENLVVLYGEAYDFDLKGAAISAGYRIVKGNADAYLDANDYYRYNYTVYDPFTGKVTAGVPGTKTSGASSGLNNPVGPGAIVELKNGKVQDNGTNPVTLGALTVASDAPVANVANDNDIKMGLVWVTDFDAKDNIVTVADVVNGLEWYKATDVANGGKVEQVYQIDNNTVVSMIKAENVSNYATWGSMSLLTAADLGSTKNDYKCYNAKADRDINGNYKKGYAKYIKAWMIIERDDNLDEGELEKVISAIILVNGVENTNHLTTTRKP